MMIDFKNLNPTKSNKLKVRQRNNSSIGRVGFFCFPIYFFSLTFFSHKTYRLIIKKLRRQIVRQQHAKNRDEQQRIEEVRQQNDPLYQAWIKQKEYLKQQRELEEERELYVKKSDFWGNYFSVFCREEGRKLRDKREQLRKQAEEEKEKETPIHNPFPPVVQAQSRPSIERPICTFYLKTGVCKYNERFVV